MNPYPHIGKPRGPLDAAAWDARYRSGDTPWDHGEPAPGLVDFLTHESYTPGTVLVPGCGRGHDCRELARHGFTVTGLDVTAAAFDGVPATPGVQYLVGDFLTHTGPYDWIFEHTCFCAIHPDLRDQYVAAAARCLKPGGHLLGIFFTFHATEGPPFGATRDELLTRFAPHFELLRDEVPRSWPNRHGEEHLFWWRRAPTPPTFALVDADAHRYNFRQTQEKEAHPSMFSNIRDSLTTLYRQDPRPWLVGFSGGKDSTMVVSLVVDAVLAQPPDARKKPVLILCTDTRVEIPAIVEMVESTLARIRRFSEQNNLNIEVNLLRPPPEQSFWVNIIGRGYPPPNRIFRWCTQRLKIDPVTTFVNQRMGHWGEAILHLGARRAESATRAQTMAGREKRNGLCRHPDLPRVWVSNPIEHLTTEEVWAYLLQKPNPWGSDNRALYKLYASASNGECPIQIDTSTPSCGNSRFGCWTCTVVERDKASEGLLASGDERMEALIGFRETLLEYQDPANGKRDMKRKNGSEGPGPLTIEARRELLTRLLKLQEEVGVKLITDDELFLIQNLWKSARRPDDGGGVARIVTRQKGILMSDWKETNRLRDLQEEVCAEKGIRAETLRRLLGKVDEFSESHRAFGLPDDLLNILKDDLRENGGEKEDTGNV